MMGYLESLKVQGFTTLAVAIFCLGGVQIMCIGILGQYMARIYREIKKRPHYIIEKSVQSDETQ
ncbi:hypothetical protein BSZ32_05890 [Rubritalea profundi]|uniref:Glycosyltransferase n=2 Tax=Rubritalea profundi TaxID=1658618 RepID=A0A2S7U0H7_9BACT|nr:hypothetical protein BSZ32_05890 [Rubritalea profundi]